MSDTPPTAFDPKLFRRSLGLFATGVTVVTTAHEGAPHGMTANAFTSVSLDPPLVLVSVDHKARMHALLSKTGRYGVSILTDAQEALSPHYAGKPQEGLNPPLLWQDGIPLVENAAVHLICRVVDAHPAGDHTLYIGRVEYLKCTEAPSPLLFYAGKYRRLAPI